MKTLTKTEVKNPNSTESGCSTPPITSSSRSTQSLLFTSRESKTMTETTKTREQQLTDAGAVFEKREDRHGDTRSGWWLDGIYLGSDARTAQESIRG